jgi:4-amino-4-deoxy-L-arabinose transferase-like glycosyltransferase
MRTLHSKHFPIIFIIVYAIVMWGGQHALRGLWEPDEARYAYVAREMAHSESWMVPVRNGEFYTHKPPLIFWLINAGSVFTGGKINGISARLPSLLGVILSLWVLFRLSCRWFDESTAWRAVFISSLSAQFWHSAGMGQIDMLLLGLEMMGLYLLFSNDDKPALWRQAGAFCFMGLAVLAKGPVGFIIPSGIYIAVTLFSGRRQNLKQWYWLWGPVLVMAFPAAWLAGAWLQGAPAQYFDKLLFAQNIGRVMGEFGGHRRPVYYFLQYLVIDFMPWFFFIPMSVKILLHVQRQKLKMLGAWIGFVVLFFSLCVSKRNLYILSVYPAMAMIVAAAWPHFLNQALKWTRATAYPLLGILLLLGGAMLVMPAVPGIPVPGYIFVPSGIALLGGGAMLTRLFIRGGLSRKWFRTFTATMIVFTLTVGMIVFPGFDEIKTPVRLAEAAQNHMPPSGKLLLYQMNGEILALYSQRFGREIRTPDDLEQAFQRTREGIAVFSQKDWEDLKDRFGRYGEAVPFRVGHKKLCYLKYASP